jgi:ornithine carbamoyltransferase
MEAHLAMRLAVRQPAPAPVAIPYLGALRGRDLLSAGDLSADELEALLEAAAVLKAEWALRHEHVARPLAGRTVALLFQKPSLRTRVSFELAVQQLGGRSLYLADADVGIERRESAADIARTLERWVDALVARTFRHGLVEDLAEAMSVPVVNALTDREHPCQALADLFTLRERFGSLRGLEVAFVGEPNNVAMSLALAGSRLGMHVRIAHPRAYGPDPELMALVRSSAMRHGGLVTTTQDPRAAVEGAQAVYADTWVSMGDEAEARMRRRAFAGYQVDADLMAAAAPDAIFLHCLPAHRGEEVTADVIDGPLSAVFDQAENRLHVQKALLMGLLGAG